MKYKYHIGCIPDGASCSRSFADAKTLKTPLTREQWYPWLYSVLWRSSLTTYIYFYVLEREKIKKAKPIILRWFWIRWIVFFNAPKKDISKTSLTNLRKSETSAYFCHVFANNFFSCNFLKTFSTGWMQMHTKGNHQWVKATKLLKSLYPKGQAARWPNPQPHLWSERLGNSRFALHRQSPHWPSPLD